MTDVLSVQHDALDDLTSDAETPPQAAPSTPESVTCRYCPSTFEGPARFIRRGRHESKDHPDEYLRAKATGRKPKKAAKKATPKARAATKSVTGPVKKKRIPAAESMSSAFEIVGQIIGNVDAPTGRAFSFSAPATGAAVDELVAGTVVDRLVIQKFAGAADKWERVGGVIAFPVLVAVVSRNPALFAPLENQLRSALVDVITASIPALEKKAAKERKAADSLARLGKIDPRYAVENDPIRVLLEEIFGVQIVSAEAGGDAAPE